MTARGDTDVYLAKYTPAGGFLWAVQVGGAFTDRAKVQDVLAAGAIGYVLKDCDPDELLSAVRAAADGHVPIDPRVAAALLPTPGGGPTLSPREEEVLRLIGTSRAWTKRYPVIAALVKNPRTPPSVSLPLVVRLAERDVKGLTVDRNVPESIRLAARKQLNVLQSRKS